MMSMISIGPIPQCIQVNSSWAKGYLRKGAALHGLHRYDDAIEAYETGLTFEDSPSMRKGLQEVKDAQNGRCLRDS
jgi:stress-induced-phosphoprotein 1